MDGGYIQCRAVLSDNFGDQVVNKVDVSINDRLICHNCHKASDKYLIKEKYAKQ